MAEIKINITEIDGTITRLKALQSRCSGMNTAAPSTVGGGRAVNELEAIAAVFKATHTSLDTLIGNTIAFLQNVRDSYVSSDTKAAAGIAKK